MSSDNSKAHQRINLDEIERHIREAPTLQPAGAAAEDPLAELARIVGGGPVPRREAPRQASANATVAAAAQLSASPSIPPRASGTGALGPITEPVFRQATRHETPQERTQFATIEDDIERLLQHNQPRPSARRPDDLENAMRSLDNLLRAKQTTASPNVNAEPLEDWRIRSTAVEAPVNQEFKQEADFETALAHAAAASNSPDAMAGRYDDLGPEAWAPAPQDELEPVAIEERSRARRPLIIVAAVLGVAAIGVGGALSMRGESGRSIGGQPPVIVADQGPTKVVPANPGGLEIPDQNRQILERSPGAPQRPAKVVNSEEQPLDLREAVRRETAANAANDAPGTVASIAVSSIAGTVSAPPAYAAAPASNATPSDAGAPPVSPSAANAQPASADATPTPAAAGVAEPRRVRTVAIKPPEPGAMTIEPTTPLPQPAAPTVVAPVVSPPAVVSRPAPAPTTPAAVEQATSVVPLAPPPAKPKVQGSIGAAREATRQAPKPAQRPPETINDAAIGAGPLQITPPARRAAEASRPVQRLAAVEPSAPVPAPVTTSDSSASGSSGNFVVQLASEGTDQSARAAISRLQSRFSELGSYSSSVQKREVRGQMRYRVRFGSMSREAASALCASLKGRGQDCILQPN